MQPLASLCPFVHSLPQTSAPLLQPPFWHRTLWSPHTHTQTDTQSDPCDSTEKTPKTHRQLSRNLRWEACFPTILYITWKGGAFCCGVNLWAFEFWHPNNYQKRQTKLISKLLAHRQIGRLFVDTTKAGCKVIFQRWSILISWLTSLTNSLPWEDSGRAAMAVRNFAEVLSYLRSTLGVQWVGLYPFGKVVRGRKHILMPTGCLREGLERSTPTSSHMEREK